MKETDTNPGIGLSPRTGDRQTAPARVMIVDDSAFMRLALSRMVANETGLRVAGTAASGKEALERMAAVDPDVVTLDIEMPGMNGLETLRRIMAEYPRPVIMVSSFTGADAEATVNALAAGAFDCVPKDLSPSSLDILHLRETLVSKIKTAADAKRSRRGFDLRREPSREGPKVRQEWRNIGVVAVGVSTGGPQALDEILPMLPGDLAIPVLIVQHMAAGFIGALAKRLDQSCSVAVCEAEQGQRLRGGTVYFAPSGRHMTVTGDPATAAIYLASSQGEIHVPSVNVMMQSVARVFQGQAMGIIMTGMGSDGAEGIQAIRSAGGLTIGQDEATCVVYGMPRACAQIGALHREVPLRQIPQEILQAARYRKVNAS